MRRHVHRIAFVSVSVVLVAALGCQSDNAGTPAYVGNEPGRIADAVSHVADAQRLEARGRTEEAVAKYRSALETYREFPAAWNNLGVLLMEEGRYLESAECFMVASDMAPSDPRPSYNLGLTWDRAGYPNDAIEHYRVSLRRDSRYLPALRGLIRAERLQGRGDADTLRHLRTALALEQDPKWREWFELQRLRLENELSESLLGQHPDR